MTTKNTNFKKKKKLTYLDRAACCNNTTIQMRSEMFAPLLKDKQSKAYKEFLKNDFIIKIKNGNDILQIRNRFLTQLHRDILDLMFLRAEKKIYKGSECLIAEFSEYEILKDLGHKFMRNRKWLRNIIRELQDINIILENKEKEIAFHILAGYGIVKNTNQHAVLFDNSYLKYFYTKDIGVGYQHLIKDIVNLESPILKAIVRFIISNAFDKFRMGIPILLENIGINKDNTNIRQYQRIVKSIKDSKGILKDKFNIILNDNTFEYVKSDKILFYNICKEQIADVLPTLIENTEREKKKKEQQSQTENI